MLIPTLLIWFKNLTADFFKIFATFFLCFFGLVGFLCVFKSFSMPFCLFFLRHYSLSLSLWPLMCLCFCLSVYCIPRPFCLYLSIAYLNLSQSIEECGEWLASLCPYFKLSVCPLQKHKLSQNDDFANTIRKES